VGKIDPTILKSIVFKYLGCRRREVLVGPNVGVDAAILNVNSSLVIFKIDPITGAYRHQGKLAVNIVSNDIACMGGKPVAITITLLLPENSTANMVEEIMREADEAARKLGISIVGGHTEVVTGMNRPPIVVTSAIGVPVKPGKIYHPRMVKPGDAILMTKTAAIEGTYIIFEEFKDILERELERDLIEEIKSFADKTTVIKEAEILAENELVHAMHDPTDGGLLEGLYEFAEAANLDFIVYEDRIKIAKSTLKLARKFNIDPLKLISSGVLLAAIPPNKIDLALNTLKDIGIEASIIGFFKEKGHGRLVKRRNGRLEYVDKPVVDELWRILMKKHF